MGKQPRCQFRQMVGSCRQGSIKKEVPPKDAFKGEGFSFFDKIRGRKNTERHQDGIGIGNVFRCHALEENKDCPNPEQQVAFPRRRPDKMVILPQIGLQRPWQQANPSICIQQIHCRIIPNDVIPRMLRYRSSQEILRTNEPRKKVWMLYGHGHIPRGPYKKKQKDAASQFCRFK